MPMKMRRILCLFLVLVLACVSAQVRSPGPPSTTCPSKCLCVRRTVRCMLLQLEKVPKVGPHTAILDLRFNKLREIPPGTFKGLRHLNTLLVNNNQLTALKDGTFAGLSNLRYLYLYKNHISHLDSNVFQGMPKLEQLYLHYNELSDINPETFSNMPSLDRLFLHNNKLQYIPSGTFSGMPALRRLRLDSNALVCDCRMVWLAKMLNDTAVQAAANCQAPQEMNGKPLKGMKPSDFHCKVPRIMEGPEDIEVSWGGTAIFRCRVDGDPLPQVIWMRDSLELPKKGERYTIMDDGSLRIENSQDTDIGQYECMAKTPEGEIKSRAARMIVTRPETGRPRFVLTPEDVTTEVGDPEIKLRCKATGDPVPVISWSHNGVQLGLTSRHQMEPEGTLIIRNVQASDYGAYRCEAANYLGRISVNAQIKINSKPLFTVHPENLEVKAGARAVLECLAVGSPNPVINWFYGGFDRPIQSGGRIQLEADNTRFVINDIKETDAGLYICEARNSLGFRVVSAEVQVKRAIENPPRLIYHPFDIVALPGTTIELPCKAEGDPPPDIQWQKDGTRLERNPQKYHVTGIGSLYIYEVSEEDTGRYECTATNEYGSISGNGLVTLKQEIFKPGRKIGDPFVEISFLEASREVDSAINNTVNALFGDHSSPPSSSDLFRLIRFPNAPARELARAAEIYERTLVNIRKHVNAGRKMHINMTDFDYKELLSPSHLELIAKKSGCMAHRQSSNCTDMCFHSKYRTFSGTCNNLQNPTWGASLTGFRRLLKPIYENGFSMPVGWTKTVKYYGYSKPSSRLVSTSLISTEEITPDNEITHMVMQWGQFLDHDLDHAIPSVSSESWDGIDCKKSCEYAAPCYPIDVPQDDPRIKNRRCIDFVRSSAICGSGMTSVFFDKVQPREQINQLTSYIDASQVYGFSDDLAEDLRELTENRGRLREGPRFPGRKALLPYAGNQGMDCRRDLAESSINCFAAGDIRANEQLGLLSMHTIWMREHNRIADELRRLNPQWEGDKIYHEARKIVGAIAQHITYEHWLPLILGPVGMDMLGKYKGYDPSINPSISNVFATAALRFGHSLINPILHRLNSSFLPISEGHIPLHKAFFSPWRLVDEGGVDPLLRGLFTVAAKLKKPDQNLNTELTEHLFKVAHAVALDLAAINIQRSRDHALPGYLDYRKICNLSSDNFEVNFDDLQNEISSENVRRKLQELYGHPGNIDVWVGGILEDQVPRGRVGPLFRCLLVEQFKRLRDGDRFWYENPSAFKPEQLTQIKQASLARIICDNGNNINEVSKNVFILPDKQGGYKTCDSIPIIDLRMWTECCNNDCSRPGQFNSLIRFNRRNRRDTHQYSYPSDKPQTYNSTVQTYSMDDQTEERLEGVEEKLVTLQKTMRQMQREIHKLKRKLLATNSCKDGTGLLHEDGHKWNVDNCTNCQCNGNTILCTVQKCPELDCDAPSFIPDQCCPICP